MGPTAFFNKTYDEALTRIIEARNYIAFQEAGDVSGLGPDARLLASQETMRITSRMTQIIAWMLCQRAVQSGEMTQERALSEEFAIGGGDVCLEDRWSDDGRLPPGTPGLPDRSRSAKKLGQGRRES